MYLNISCFQFNSDPSTFNRLHRLLTRTCYHSQNPQPPLSWSGIRNATTPASDCIQKNSLLPNPTVSGEEDCLYLNLYRPIRSDVDHARLPLPVIVYIHGGAFFAGSPSPYIVGPQRFMATGRVLMVTIAYRLGALGFLSTGDSEAPGNFGLKDQSMALSWVQQNAVHFGGDPNRVTLMGVSAGAASVHLHMMSPRSKGTHESAIECYDYQADHGCALSLTDRTFPACHLAERQRSRSVQQSGRRSVCVGPATGPSARHPTAATVQSRPGGPDASAARRTDCRQR